MDKLELYFEYISNNGCADAYDDEVYEILTEIERYETEDARFEDLISNLHRLCAEGKLSKYYVYLCCLANSDHTALQKFLEYDKSQANLKAITVGEVFEYVVYKRKHWFLKVLEEFDTLGKQHFNDTVYQKILTAKLIELSNSPEIDTEQIKNILNVTCTSNDNFIEFYKHSVQDALNVISFMEHLDLAGEKTNQMFNFIICNSLLSSLSKYIPLGKTEYWDKIANKLQENDRCQGVSEATQENIFTSFSVIYTILSFVLSSNRGADVKTKLQKTEEDFFKITSPKLQLELIKILFIIMFLRKEHLKYHAEEDPNEHLNTSKSLNIILQFLKNIFDAIKVQSKFAKESAEYKTLSKFNKHLADAIWRYELVAQVRSSKLSTSHHRLIPYMLAPPESLVNLCLKQRDFERARQVVKVSHNFSRTCSSFFCAYSS